jgi:hypothetical protein
MCGILDIYFNLATCARNVCDSEIRTDVLIDLWQDQQQQQEQRLLQCLDITDYPIDFCGFLAIMLGNTW